MNHGLGCHPTTEAIAAQAPKFRAWRASAGRPVLRRDEPLDLRHLLAHPWDQKTSGACGGYATASVLSAAFGLCLQDGLRFDPWWLYALANGGRDDGVSLWELARQVAQHGALPLPDGRDAPMDADEAMIHGLYRSDRYGRDAWAKAGGYVTRDVLYIGTEAGHSAEQAWEEVQSSIDYARPVVLGIVVTDRFEATGPSGVPDPGGNPLGGHALAVVGRTAEGRLLVRNSWGAAWGLQGDCLLDKGHVLQSDWIEAVSVSSIDYPGEPPFPYRRA